MARITQKERVLQYIKEHGSITRLKAANDIGCFELASRIGELEDDGFKFIRTRRKGKNRFGDKVRWIEYSLEEE